MSELVLTALDGGNPLGFLAALGTVRTLSLSSQTKCIRMRWQGNSCWNPVITSTEFLSHENVVTALAERFRQLDNENALGIDDDLKIGSEKFREFAEKAAHAAKPQDRSWADFVAAFGCDAVSTDGLIQDTALRTMSGAGHQHFLKTMRELAELTTPEDLQKALFEPWRYEDDKPSLRWDPADDRRYALRWDEPSGDPIRTVRGANRLAIEALPLLPTVPVQKRNAAVFRLETTCFTGTGSRDTYFTWPIWTRSIPLDVIRSVLALAELQEQWPPRSRLLTLGIEEVYRSQRLTIGKLRNFAPGQPV